MSLQTAFIESPLGVIKLEGNDDGVQSAWFVDLDETHITQHIPEALQACADQLGQYFQKKRKTFDLKLNPQGTEFQQKVWADLYKVPFGRTESYQTMSRRFGDIKAIRAIAAANGKNPIGIIIPCHRIVGSDGSLTGYAGGLWRKKWLIDFELGGHQGTLF